MDRKLSPLVLLKCRMCCPPPLPCWAEPPP